MRRTLAMFLFLATGAAVAGEPAFDVHVHLREGETSLRAYQAHVKVAGLELTCGYFAASAMTLSFSPAVARREHL